MYKSIKLKFSNLKEPLELPVQGITILVGPNNSGKSLALREMEQALHSDHPMINLKIFHDFEAEWPSDEEIKELEKYAQGDASPDHLAVFHYAPQGGLDRRAIHRPTLQSFLLTKNNKHWLSANLLRRFVVRLDGKTRFELTNDRAAGDLVADAPINNFVRMFKDDKLREEVRAYIKDALGRYFVLDPLLLGQLRIRLSSVPPVNEQSLDEKARNFHKDATYIKDASDGVQAFVGIITALLSGDYKLFLVDEPEAFLHPPLARRLGYALSDIARKISGGLIAATHSADFLLGCLQASTDVRIVRLEYTNGVSKARLVDSSQLARFVRHPLMRSANVFSALFHDGVIITESDNDRAFYQEIYYRMLEADRSLPAILFVNAQNKQTIAEIMEPLRKFGIPAAGIADIDLVKDGGTVFTNWMKAAQFPVTLHHSLSVQRGDVRALWDKCGKDMKKDGGVAALEEEDSRAASVFFDLLDHNGIFSVRRGELENWLPHLGAIGKKTDWVISALERMGSDPASEQYLHASTGDVWDFMHKIVNWINNPSRAGTP